MPSTGRSNGSDRRDFLKRLSDTVRKCGRTAEVARAIGVSIKTLQRMMAGATDPGRDELVTLARLADVPVGWLAAGELVAISGAGWLRQIHIREDGELQLDLRGHEIAEIRWQHETWLLIRPHQPRAVRP